jgi:hypothetical protein
MKAGARIVGRLSFAVACLSLLAVAGCSTPKLLRQGGIDANYFDGSLRYEHPFTDAALESVRKDAERECATRKQVAVKSQASSACTLDRCVTYYQCVKPSGAADYGK